MFYDWSAPILFSFYTLTRGPAPTAFEPRDLLRYMQIVRNIPWNRLKIKSLKSEIPLKSATGLGLETTSVLQEHHGSTMWETCNGFETSTDCVCQQCCDITHVNSRSDNDLLRAPY